MFIYVIIEYLLDSLIELPRNYKLIQKDHVSSLYHDRKIKFKVPYKAISTVTANIQPNHYIKIKMSQYEIILNSNIFDVFQNTISSKNLLASRYDRIQLFDEPYPPFIHYLV